MATSYFGKPGNITAGATFNIASSTDATPIEITTTAPHGLATGEGVEVQDHTVNYHANRTWAVTWVSSTKFTLTGSTGTGGGAGGATGTVRALCPRPAAALPDGSDPRAAASWDVPLETHSDEIAWLSERAGALSIAQEASAAVADATATSWSLGSTSAGVWAPNDTDGVGAGGGGVTALAAGAIVNLAADSRDRIDAYFSTWIINGATAISFSLFLAVYDPGVSYIFSAVTEIVGSGFPVPGSYNGPLVMRGFRYPANTDTRGKKARVYLAHKEAGGGATYNLVGSRQLIVQVRRNALVMP